MILFGKSAFLFPDVTDEHLMPVLTFFILWQTQAEMKIVRHGYLNTYDI